MSVIKQRTVGSGNQKTTIVLKQEKNKFHGLSDNEYQYTVEEKGGSNFGDPVFTKQEGLQEFEDTVRNVKRGMSSSSSASFF